MEKKQQKLSCKFKGLDVCGKLVIVIIIIFFHSNNMHYGQEGQKETIYNI
jgi:hypothetical protein